MKNCEIVKDLLPNYIEKLTKEETSTFIEKHIDKCKKCRKYYENMNFNIDIKEINKKEIQYLKKINKKIYKAIFLGIILGLLSLVILYLSIVIYRFHVLNTVSNKYSQYEQVNNIYIEFNYTLYDSNNSFKENIKRKYWYKDNKVKIEYETTTYPDSIYYTRIIDFNTGVDYIFFNKEKQVIIRDSSDAEMYYKDR